jgi:DNA-binding transcriptional regulator YiaG
MQNANTAREIMTAALLDPDAQPLTAESATQLHMVPRIKTLRRALGLTPEEFAGRYQIPHGTLLDWEQGRAEPDQPAPTSRRLPAIPRRCGGRCNQRAGRWRVDCAWRQKPCRVRTPLIRLKIRSAQAGLSCATSFTMARIIASKSRS